MRTALGLLLLALLCFGHGSTYTPPPEDRDPPPMPPPPPPPPPPVPPREPPNTPQRGPKGPTTPPERPPPQAPPNAPPAGPSQPGAPGTRPVTRPEIRNPVRRRPSNGSGGAWKIWWEHNREHLVGLRSMTRDPGTVTGKATGKRDPLAGSRDRVLAALRATVRKGEKENDTVRAAAVIALGRMGTDHDARLIVRLLHDREQPNDVLEAAAVAVGILPPIKETDTRSATSAYLRYVIENTKILPRRPRGLAVLATGLRGRHDPGLVLYLVGRTTRRNIISVEAANLALSLGLARSPMAMPELMRAARKGKLGNCKLSDIGRAHATQGLALCGDSAATPILAGLLMSRSAGVQTRRAAALSLGRLLRESALTGDRRQRAVRALLHGLEKGQDVIVRGFSAVSLGTAAEPAGTQELMAAIDHGGNAEIKPFCALGLGFAARTTDDRHIRRFLAEELEKTNAQDLAEALSISLGLARANGAEKALLEVLQSEKRDSGVRGAAAQGLGLMNTRSPEAGPALEKIALKSRDPYLLEDVVLALGMMGRRGVARELAAMLRKTKSGVLQARIILALSHLDHSAAVEPLLGILEDVKAQSLVREFAAVALGMMGDRRERDLLFELDAYFNFYATTYASNELVRLY